MPSVWRFSGGGKAAVAPSARRARTTDSSVSRGMRRSSTAGTPPIEAWAAARSPGASTDGLALAVVAEAGRLQDPGEQLVRQGRAVLALLDHRERGVGEAVVAEEGLLGDAVLAHPHRGAAGAHDGEGGQVVEGVGGHVLELGRDRGARPTQPVEGLDVVVGGDEVVVGDAAGGAGLVGVEHPGRVAELLRGPDEVPPELAAAEDTDGGGGQDHGSGSGGAAGPAPARSGRCGTPGGAAPPPGRPGRASPPRTGRRWPRRPGRWRRWRRGCRGASARSRAASPGPTGPRSAPARRAPAPGSWPRASPGGGRRRRPRR